MRHSAAGAETQILPDWIGAADLPLYRIGIWTSDGYLAQDVRAANEWSAVGSVMLHLRATDPDIMLQPRGISVTRAESPKANLQ